MPGPSEGTRTFEEFFQEMWRLVHSYLVTRVGVDEADDVAQEVFAVAYRRWPLPGMGPEHRRRWLMSVARSKAKDHLRSRARRGRLKRHLESQPSETAPDPIDRVKARDLAYQLAEIVGVRSEVDVELLILLAEERSTREMADILGVSISAVTSRVNRLRKRLAEHRISLTDETEATDV